MPVQLRKLNKEEVAEAHDRLMTQSQELITGIYDFYKTQAADEDVADWGDVGTAAEVRDRLAYAAVGQGSITGVEYTEITGKAY